MFVSLDMSRSDKDSRGGFVDSTHSTVDTLPGLLPSLSLKSCAEVVPHGRRSPAAQIVPPQKPSLRTKTPPRSQQPASIKPALLVARGERSKRAHIVRRVSQTFGSISSTAPLSSRTGRPLPRAVTLSPRRAVAPPLPCKVVSPTRRFRASHLAAREVPAAFALRRPSSEFHLELEHLQRSDFIGSVGRASFSNGKDRAAFAVGKKLGEGAFGDVHLLIGRGGGCVAGCERVLKVVNKQRAAHKGASAAILQREIDVLRIVDHPHIVRLFEYTDESDNLSLVMDICKGGDLLDLVARFAKDKLTMPEPMAGRCFCQILEAVSYCHSKGVFHRDIKLENVMLRNIVTAQSPPQVVHAVLVDFGLAGFFGTSQERPLRSRELAGSPPTMAPEMLKREGDYKSDIFSIGCVLYAVLNPSSEWTQTGDERGPYCYPFLPISSSTDPDGYISLYALHHKGPPMQKLRNASASARHAVRQLLSFHKSKRPDANECLKLPWLVIAEAKCKSAPPPIRADIRALSKDRRFSAWQRAVIMQAATQLPALKLAKLEESFRTLDRHCMGSVTRDDLRHVVEGIGMSAEESGDAIELLLSRHDADGSGTIEWTEFVAAMIPTSEVLLSVALEMVFLRLDHDFDGRLKWEELLALRGTEDHPELKLLNDDDLRDLFSGCDGQITLSEFKACFTDRL